jgi:hypothetical protein
MSGLRCCAISPFPVELEEKLSATSSVYEAGKVSNDHLAANFDFKIYWRLLILPWLNLLKVGLLRYRGL